MIYLRRDGLYILESSSGPCSCREAESPHPGWVIGLGISWRLYTAQLDIWNNFELARNSYRFNQLMHIFFRGISTLASQLTQSAGMECFV